MIPHEFSEDLEDACSDLKEDVEKHLRRYVSDYDVDAEVVLAALMRIVGGIILDAPDRDVARMAINSVEAFVADIKDYALAGHA